MEEEYRNIVEFPNYEVSNLGNVQNKKSGRILKGGCNKGGYMKVILYDANSKKTRLVHRLMALTFIDNPEKKSFVDHINNNRSDNDLINLRWATNTENQQNSKLSSKNTSGYKGVCFDKSCNKWKASIRIDGIKIHIGNFKTIEEAKLARITRANEVFGVFTNAIEKIV